MRTSHYGASKARMTSQSSHRHGTYTHAHPHAGPHRHVLRLRRSMPLPGPRAPSHRHSHGLVDQSVKRSRAGMRAVGLGLAVLGLTAGLQTVVFVISGSVALLADVIHNFGDAATAIPLGIAFALRSDRAERWAGLAVVLAIFVSAGVSCSSGVSPPLAPARTPPPPAGAAAAGVARRRYPLAPRCRA